MIGGTNWSTKKDNCAMFIQQSGSHASKKKASNTDTPPPHPIQCLLSFLDEIALPKDLWGKSSSYMCNRRVPGARSTFFCCPDLDQIDAAENIETCAWKTLKNLNIWGPESLIFLLKWRVMLLNLTHLQVIMNFKWGKGRKTTFGFN